MDLSLEPTWPWSLPNVGLPAMLAVALLLAGLTVWTYSGVRKATWRRLMAVLILRLCALALTFLALLRPSFGVTHLEGLETSKLLVIFDASESMSVPDMPNSATRWQQAKRIWESRDVRQRLEQLAAEQKIEVVKYLGADDLRPDAKDAAADGKRTDIGAWLHQLGQKHGHEKHLRGIVLFSDGADNGTRFPVQAEARKWRGICPIVAFGAGNPNDPKFRKDIALTSLVVNPATVGVKSKMTITAIAQAPGFLNTMVEFSLFAEDVRTKESKRLDVPPGLFISKEKDLVIKVEAIAPDLQGEYKLTVKIKPHADETNKDNNEISTYVQVTKEKINVLWVDRPRVYEPVAAIRTLKTDARFEVHYVEPPLQGITDPIKFYFDEQPQFDVIVIGDISAQRFSFGKDDIFVKLKDLVQTRKMGLLMLGGEKTFATGGWSKHRDLMSLLPVTFNKPGFVDEKIAAKPTADGLAYSFLKQSPSPKENDKLWTEDFEPLEGVAIMEKTAGSQELLKGKNGELVLAATQSGGHVAVFAADSTAKAWRTSPEAVAGYQRFWKQLVLWLAQQQDDTNPLWIKLDKRRLNTSASEVLGFTFGLRDKKRNELSKAKFTTVEVIGPNKQKFPVTFLRDDPHPYQRGTFQGAKDPGEYQLVIKGHADGIEGDAQARFLVVNDDIEILRPAADHETLSKIAAAADGRFYRAEETQLLQYLDELKSQVNTEGRLKTTQWPDWSRLPPSAHARDQLAGLWNSFALVSFLLFTALLGSEWLLRRLWGLV